MEKFSVSVSILGFIWNWIKLLILKIKNLIKRPKLNVRFLSKNVTFVDKDNKEQEIPYFCLIIKNLSNKVILFERDTLYINRESYDYLRQSDKNYLWLNPNSQSPWKSCQNDILNFYQGHCGEIYQNKRVFRFEPHQSYIFPIYPYESNSHSFTGSKEKSLLFFSRNKVNVTIMLNSKIFEYGINRKQVYEFLINFLAFNKYI